jgi:hypothetical protein
MGGVNGEIDCAHRSQDLSPSPKSPGHVRREANDRTINLCNQQDRRTEWASHMLPVKELAGRNALNITRPLPKGRLQHFENTGLVLRVEGPDFDRAVESYGTRRHRKRTIDHKM